MISSIVGIKDASNEI
jgi:hypothetical protein